MTSSMKQVQMPHEFFRKSKQEYRNWRFAMIRELIQNSYDALAANIAFSLREESVGLILTCEDDGVGMDSDTMESVLLCLGGTKKPDGAIGGKGWAKQILFFAHRSYSIHCHDNLVTGTGGSYAISPAAHRRGTRIEVALDDDTHALEDWSFIIREYVGKCYMEWVTGRGVNITLGDQLLEQQNDAVYDISLDHEIGAIWYNEVKGRPRSSFAISVNGLPMFETFVYSDTCESALEGGVELAAGSVALTANRDGFADNLGDEFAQLIAGLVQNQTSIRLGKALEFPINFVPTTGQPGSDAADGGGNVSPCAFRHGADSAAEAPDVYCAVLERIDRSNYPRNFHVKVESLTARGSAKIEAHITASALVAELNKHRSAKLARIWRAAISTILNCEWALGNGVAFHDGLGTEVIDWQNFDGDGLDLQMYFRGRRVDTGFCFIAGAEGACSVVIAGNKPHRIFINPVLLTSENAYRNGDLLDVAYHEAAHLWEPHHGEAFCRVEGKLRQSVRRWLSEKDMVARIALVQTL
jgi:hypothetical protein